jgi:hypothetical protein
MDTTTNRNAKEESMTNATLNAASYGWDGKPEREYEPEDQVDAAESWGAGDPRYEGCPRCGMVSKLQASCPNCALPMLG